MIQTFFGHLSMKIWASSFPPFVVELYIIGPIGKQNTQQWPSNSSAQASKKQWPWVSIPWTPLWFEYEVSITGSCLERFVFSCRRYFGSLGCGSVLEVVGRFWEHIIPNHFLSGSLFADPLLKYLFFFFAVVIKNL